MITLEKEQIILVIKIAIRIIKIEMKIKATMMVMKKAILMTKTQIIRIQEMETPQTNLLKKIVINRQIFRKPCYIAEPNF